MAKKTSSIHIEQKLWDYIADYQKQNNIDSRNTAIEWILVEHRGNCSTSNPVVVKDEKNVDKNTNTNLEYRESDSILQQMEDDMPD